MGLKLRCPLYPPKADIRRSLLDVRFVPIADIALPRFQEQE
jgi:hypothetical protein